MTKNIEKTSKITAVKTVKDIPFAADTKVHGRVKAVLTSKTVADAIRKGARMSTVRFAVTKRMIKLTPVSAKVAA